jgi:plasmid stabilization system protein ParE
MYLSRIERRALAEFDRWRPDLLPPLESRLGPDAAARAWDEARTRFRALLGAMPDPGWRAPLSRAFSIGGAIYVAVYLALRPRGLDAAGAWEICDAATRTHFARLRGLTRWAASAGMFSSLTRWLTRSLARRSRAAPVGGWVAEYVPPAEGQQDYGVTYTRCAIRELAVAHGAADFAPYICLSDVIGSDELGWGLRRTETLAQGGTRCDFRFRRGQPTDVVRRLPVL